MPKRNIHTDGADALFTHTEFITVARLTVSTSVVSCFDVKLASSLHDKCRFIDKQDIVRTKILFT